MPRSPVCVDASIVVALVTAETQSERALTLWAEWMQGGIRVIAPTLLQCEATSALRRKVMRGTMSLPDARRALEVALSLAIELLDPPGLSLRALDLAVRLNRPAAYDAYYLALAEMMGAEFWTADEKLYNAVRDEFPHIHWVGTADQAKP
ncbi:MAG: type II toxin-antitoxin system VapC family toxin [Chloroflexi bacterium]|nr:type II toxin-antitoxin system VapC family toxin [Chloroflexota bacterium]